MALLERMDVALAPYVMQTIYLGTLRFVTLEVFVKNRGFVH